MGLIANALAVRDETRSISDFLNDDYDPGVSVAGVTVNRKTALSMTTIWRCVDLLSSSLAQSPKDVIIQVGDKRFPEFNPPRWLNVPDPARPSYTSSDYFGQVVVSLLLDGNYFVWAAPSIYDPIVLTVLDPQKVTITPDFRYEIRNSAGALIDTLDQNEVLHGTWLVPPGERRGISPLESLRRAIGGAVAAEEHAARFFGQGAALSFGVEVPGALEKAQKEELRNALRDAHAGLKNSHNIGVLTAGAKFVAGLAPTPEQAQMLATRQFSVEDLCRPFGVPPHMVGSQQPGAVSYASVEGTLAEFKYYAVLPLARRIEEQHNRLVQLPDTLLNTNAKAQFKFNLDGIARAELLTRYQAHSSGILGGFLTPNEARRFEDLMPLDGGDRLFMQSQMVPLEAVDDTTISRLISQVQAGLVTHDEAREELGRKPIEWSEDMTKEDTETLIAQVNAGLITHDEARAKMKLSPIKWSDDLTPDEITLLMQQLDAGLVTHDEARKLLKLPPIQWSAEDLSKDETEVLIAQLNAGLRTHDEARAKMGLPPVEWPETPEQLATQVKDGILSVDEARKKLGLGPMIYDETPSNDEMLDQVKAGVRTHDEARELLNLPPMKWSEELSTEEVASINAQLNSGLLTIDEARAKLGRPPIQWPDDLNDKIKQAEALIKTGFDPTDTMVTLGLPPIKHLGLPPITVQKVADAEGVEPVADTPPEVIPNA